MAQPPSPQVSDAIPTDVSVESRIKMAALITIAQRDLADDIWSSSKSPTVGLPVPGTLHVDDDWLGH